MLRKLLYTLSAAALFGASAFAAQVANTVGPLDVAPIINPQINGHMSAVIDNAPGALPPVIAGTACTGALAGATLTDFAGAVVPSGAGTCTVTFSHAYRNAPICIANNSSAVTALPLASATTTVLTITSAAAATSVQYVCIGY